ncbi:hypothetical protein SLS58_002862 [Diplodia intermedia]|uniref:FHA domain-containing protein n=1 Tax=Diplodia intermedia TaxID=856260 RepID=A0ABR3TYH3_9PEZI
MSYPVEQMVKFISREHRDGIPDDTVEHIPFRQVTLKDNISYTFGQVRRNLARFAPAKTNLATHSPMVAQWQARISRGNDPTPKPSQSVYIANVASASSTSTTLINNMPLRPGRRREVFSGATITLGRRPVCRGKVRAAVTYPPKFQLLVEPVIVTPAGPRPYYVFCSEVVAAEKARAVEAVVGEGAAEVDEADGRGDDDDDDEEAEDGADAGRVWYPGLPLPAEDFDTADGDGCGGLS